MRMYKRQRSNHDVIRIKNNRFYTTHYFSFSLRGKFPFWYLVPIGFASITIISAIVGWYYKVYWVENNVLHVKQGLFVKKESYLNKERVQTINTSSNVLYQMLGLKKFRLKQLAGAMKQKLA